MGKKQFKAESKRLLDLMINSIYTNKEIFLREIISNASDAIDKLCYISLTDDKVGLERSDYRIRITVDKDARTITVSDNGIGMSQDEAEKNLGVIAKSGSYNFKNDMSAEEAEKDDISIIGQFGVGFYSAFMVSDKVTVITKKYGEEKGVKWESTGADGYTEEVYGSYLEIWKLKALVKKYSDYVRWPIVMDITHQEQQPTGEEDKDGKPIMHTVNVTAPETVNSMVPIWQRAKTEVTDDECVAWYKETNRDQTDPAAVLRINAEGVVSYKALLFIPGKDIDNGISGAAKKGVKLYCNGVLIMEDCDKLLHDYFEFARGVVEGAYDLLYVVNRSRNLTHDPAEALSVLREIEAASHLRATAVVNNTHLAGLTDGEVLGRGVAFAQEVAASAGLPLAFTAVPASALEDVDVPGVRYPVSVHVKKPWE